MTIPNVAQLLWPSCNNSHSQPAAKNSLFEMVRWFQCREWNAIHRRMHGSMDMEMTNVATIYLITDAFKVLHLTFALCVNDWNYRMMQFEIVAVANYQQVIPLILCPSKIVGTCTYAIGDVNCFYINECAVHHSMQKKWCLFIYVWGDKAMNSFLKYKMGVIRFLKGLFKIRR